MSREESPSPEEQVMTLGKTQKKYPMTMKQKRSVAKKGMIVSMGTLVITGFMRKPYKRVSKQLHLFSGIALVGFSLWHNSLYGSQKAKSVNEGRSKGEE